MKKLRAGDWLSELLPIKPVLPRGLPTGIGSAHSSPGNSIARPVQAAEGALQALDARQQRVFAHFNVFQHDLAGDAGT